MKNFLLISLFLLLISTPTVSAATQEEARTELQKLLIPYSEDSFINYAAMGNERVVNLFLDAGMDPNIKNSLGWTALMFAAYGNTQGNHQGILQTLLNANADVNAKTVQDETALYFAAMGGKKAAVAVLLEKGADTKIKTKLGMTAVSIAKALGKKDIAELITKFKSNDPDIAATQTALPPILSDPHISRALAEGSNAEKFDRGIQQKGDFGSYAIEAYFTDAYTMAKNLAHYSKQRNLKCTIDDVKEKVLTPGVFHVNWQFYLKHSSVGAGPNKYTYAEDDFVLIQGNKSIKPQGVNLMPSNKVNPDYNVGGAMADVFLPIPIFSLGFLSSKSHIYTVDTTWDWNEVDLNKPFAIRLFFGEKFVEMNFDLKQKN